MSTTKIVCKAANLVGSTARKTTDYLIGKKPNARGLLTNARHAYIAGTRDITFAKTPRKAPSDVDLEELITWLDKS